MTGRAGEGREACVVTAVALASSMTVSGEWPRGRIPQTCFAGLAKPLRSSLYVFA